MKSQELIRIPEVNLCLWAFPLNFFWEMAHTYFYTLKEAPFKTMLYGWVHCTIGDVLITLGIYWVVSFLSLNRRWFLDLKREKARFIGFIILGVGYTSLSEWLNVHLFRSWGYDQIMPVIPWLHLGLTPLLQWVIVPPISLLLVRRYLLSNR